MQIVELTKEHVDKFILFRKQASQDSVIVVALDKTESLKVINDIQTDPAQQAFVAIDKNSIVGQLFVKLVDKEHSLQIMLISVLASYYGTSLSKELLNKAIEIAKDHKYDKIKLIVRKNNLRAIEFYEKHGFKLVGDYTHKTFIYTLAV